EEPKQWHPDPLVSRVDQRGQQALQPDGQQAIAGRLQRGFIDDGLHETEMLTRCQIARVLNE
ncbi:unnamed protein product, partial [Anisakis simplex]|uniref:Transcriptional regulator n=1 Tax=Anisakis simplex TaxID=6269 RepID=A0A0M3JM53_ANISI